MKRYRGFPEPLGVTFTGEEIRFALFSMHAEKVSLVLIHPTSHRIIEEIPLDPNENKTGTIWHIALEGVSLPLLYAYRLEGPRKEPHFFRSDLLLVDPYARCIDVPKKWGRHIPHYHPRGVLDRPKPYDWEGISSPRRSLSEWMIYEMHVRGFTQDASSRVSHPGTFLGVIEKIPYLLELGMNAIELLPCQEFNECEWTKKDPITGEQLVNFWGYSPLFFFFPMARYASDSSREASIMEWKTMVKELHRNGIEVILDVVFNHTGEKKNKVNAYSWMGIDRGIYYQVDEKGHDKNFSGCGNTVNLNHPVCRKFVRDCLHYWVTEMHVDGFRFDLASVMNRGRGGELLAPSPLVESLTEDPILAETKLIAEPWDCAGAYQLGGFAPHQNRWSEWNGKYRDTVRSFIKGDPGSKNAFASVVYGSHDLFAGRSPQASINFVTAHDGYTLYDLVAYQEKHNERNGEENHDGNDHNISWNGGEEGETSNEEIGVLRLRQRKNFLVALFFSQGVPMLSMGDEYGHTRQGNNNPWCQDNALNWFSWSRLEEEREFFRFVKKLIAIRKAHPILRKADFLTEEEIQWHGLYPGEPNWEDPMPILSWTLGKEFFIAFNASAEEREWILPPADEGHRWACWIDTSRRGDFSEKKQEMGASFLSVPYSAFVLKMIPARGGSVTTSE